MKLLLTSGGVSNPSIRNALVDMWQYSGTLPVPGIGAQTTGEVFFGTPLQYEAFRRGEGNVGLEAAR